MATLTTVRWSGSIAHRRRSRRRGNISSSAASASRSPCSARSSSIWRRGRSSAKGVQGMVWTILIAHVAAVRSCAAQSRLRVPMLGYGTKVGLAPLHAWLPDAHAEGPTPISAVLSGLLLNVALYAVLRFKLLLDANPGAHRAGPVDGDARPRFGGVRRLHAVSPPRHETHVRLFLDRAHGRSSSSRSAWAEPLANFAGLLHMAMHSLTKSAIFFTVGHIAQVKGTQQDRRHHGPHRKPAAGSAGASSSACSRSRVCRRWACS